MLGTLLLAVASGFLGGVVVLSSGVGLARARRVRALRAFGTVTLLTLIISALFSGIAFVWLVALTHSPAVGAFALGAGFGAAVGVAVALVVGLSLVAWLLVSSPARPAAGGYVHAPLGRRVSHW